MIRKLLWNYFVPVVLAGVLYLYIRSLRVSTVDADLKPIRNRDRSKPYLYAHFHEDIPVASLYHAFSNVCTMSSKSRDGELIARVLSLLGFKMIRGSTRHFGKETAKEFITQVKMGKDLAVAVDGPRGPRRIVKEGALFLARLTKTSVVAMVSASKNPIVLEKSWDRMLFPRPFSKVLLIYGNPLSEKQISKKELEEEIIALKEKAELFLKNK